MDKIHITLAFCDPKGTYCQHAAVTIASIFANTKSKIAIHILHDNTLTVDNKSKLETLAEKFGQEIDFANIDTFLNTIKIDISKFLIAGKNKGMLFRLFLPQLLAEDRTIYLDCDIVVTLDIAQLWNIGAQGKVAIAVQDTWIFNYMEKGTPLPKEKTRVWNEMGITATEYFNSGVLVLNLKKMREEYDFQQSVQSFYERFKRITSFADQDCLNSIFANDTMLIDEKFNRIRYNKDTLTDDILNNSIWHMAGVKPWEFCTRPMVDDLYWLYFMQTPYCNSPQELISAMSQSFASAKFLHKHTSACAKRIWQQLKHDIVNGHIWIPVKVYLNRTINILHKLR